MSFHKTCCAVNLADLSSSGPIASASRAPVGLVLMKRAAAGALPCVLVALGVPLASSDLRLCFAWRWQCSWTRVSRVFLASPSLSAPSSLLCSFCLFAVSARRAAFASASLVATVATLVVAVHLRFASWRPPPCAPVAPESATCVASSSTSVALLRRRPLAVCSGALLLSSLAGLPG